MLYMIIGSSIVFYLAMTHVTFKFTRRIRRAWFGDNLQKTNDALLALSWPFSLPAFYHVYWDQIKGVKQGKDWADANINEPMREDFRNKYMRDSTAA